MKYNEKLAILKSWCLKKAKEYHSKNMNLAGCSAYEIAFKLMQLIDQDFDNDDTFIERINALLAVHYDYSLLTDLNKTQKHIINKIENNFLLYVQEVLTSKTELFIPEMQYERVITGHESDDIISQINSKWEYYNDSYWFPLIGNEPQSVSDKFFIMKKYVAPYWTDICNYIFRGNSHIYSYGESSYDLKYCTETSKIDDVETEEWSYTDKNFTWFIYLSHEDTVSFAGAILPIIKEILYQEKKHWDCFEYPEL